MREIFTSNCYAKPITIECKHNQINHTPQLCPSTP